MNTPDSTADSTPTNENPPVGGPAPAPVPSPPARMARPTPAGLRPAPPVRPVSPAPPVRPAPPAQQWGRVAEDGTVFVRTADGERQVGQMPDATPTEAMAFFTRRYDDLAFEVDLLEQRVRAGTLGPDEAAASVKKVHATLQGAQAVGDLAGLDARLEALTRTIRGQREQRREEKARRLEDAKRHKERIATEAERLSADSDWRNGANRMRQLLEEWKALPRLERSVDDSLWHRFSAARTTYTRRRKAHFSDLNERRDQAQIVKERLVVEAETISTSTEWGPTAGTYRDLMRQWKAAGPAPKGVDDQLWQRFRGAQDTFFGNRDAANAELDAELAANGEKKEALLVEAEALVPVTDLQTAKESFRDIAERWDATGKVPRDRMKELEGRFRTVEQALRGVEDDKWKHSNPEARARAADTVSQLVASIADLRTKHDQALGAGNPKRAQEHAAAIEARESWLIEAEKAFEEFSG